MDWSSCRWTAALRLSPVKQHGLDSDPISVSVLFRSATGGPVASLARSPAVPFRPRGETTNTNRQWPRSSHCSARARPLRCFSVSPRILPSPVSAVGTHLLSSVHTPTRARRGGMACAAAPSPLPARRSTTAPCVVFAVGPHPPRFYRPFKPSTGGAPRSSLRVVASSSKADPVEERLPVAPLADVPVSANASSPGPPVEPQPQVSTG